MVYTLHKELRNMTDALLHLGRFPNEDSQKQRVVRIANELSLHCGRKMKQPDFSDAHRDIFRNAFKTMNYVIGHASSPDFNPIMLNAKHIMPLRTAIKKMAEELEIELEDL